MSRIRGVLVVAAALALGACEDVVDPDSARDTYVLTAVNGDPLPAVMFDGEQLGAHVVATATSGTLTLREVTFTERVIVDLVIDGEPFGEDAVEISGDYSIDGQLLDFDPDQAGSPSFTGTLQGGMLTTVEVHPDFGELTLTWQR